MKILLTGCHGQLGQALQAVLSDHELVCTDTDTLDITDCDQVENYLTKYQPKLVINSAAYTQVDQAEDDQDKAYAVNTKGPEYLARACHDIDATLIQISTDYVFDGSSQSQWRESDSTNPLSVYGKSKLAGEQAVTQNCRKHFIVRTAWLYHFSGQNFLKSMYSLASRDEVRVVDDQCGSPTNADDLADALTQLIETDDYGIHHLVNAGEATWYELTCEFYQQLGIKTVVIPVSTDEFPRPAPRPKSSVLVSEHQSPIQLPDWKQGVQRLVTQIQKDGWS